MGRPTELRPARGLQAPLTGRKAEEPRKVLVGQPRPFLAIHDLHEAASINNDGGVEGITLAPLIKQAFEVPRVHGHSSHLK